MNAKIRVTTNLIFKGIAVAMGIAVVALSLLGTLTASNGMLLLGLGLAVLAIGSLRA